MDLRRVKTQVLSVIPSTFSIEVWCISCMLNYDFKVRFIKFILPLIFILIIYSALMANSICLFYKFPRLLVECVLIVFMGIGWFRLIPFAKTRSGKGALILLIVTCLFLSGLFYLATDYTPDKAIYINDEESCTVIITQENGFLAPVLVVDVPINGVVSRRIRVQTIGDYIENLDDEVKVTWISDDQFHLTYKKFLDFIYDYHENRFVYQSN